MSVHKSIRQVWQRVLRFWEMGFFHNYDGLAASGFAFIESKTARAEVMMLIAIWFDYRHDLYLARERASTRARLEVLTKAALRMRLADASTRFATDSDSGGPIVRSLALPVETFLEAKPHLAVDTGGSEPPPPSQGPPPPRA